MRSNKEELLALASQTSQNFDREGVIIVKERHSFFRRSEGFTARWFRLRGNLLFYLKGPEPWYEPLGVIVLGNHKVNVHPQNEHGHWPFQLVWENEVCYCLATLLESERSLWLKAMANAPYETLTQRIADLQQQLDDTRTMIDLKKYRTTNKIINDFNEAPLCELSLSCDNLPCDANGQPPSAFATVFALFSDKALCVRYGCTEVVEKCSNPNFLRTIMFRESDGINSSVMIRILVYDMREIVSQTGVAIGSVTMRLSHIQEAQRLRVPLLTAENKGVGFVTFNGWSVDPTYLATSPTQPPNPEKHTIDLTPTLPAHRRSQSMPSRMGLKLLYPSYSVLVRQNFLNPHQTTYRFHSGLGGDIIVHEALAEPSFCFTMPLQLVDIFLLREQELSESMVAFTEVSRRVSPRLMDLVGNHITIMRLMQSGKLAEEHEKTHSSAIIDLDAAKTEMLNHSIYFKPSIRKVDDIPEEPGLAYVPINLHVQRMWAHNDTLNKCGFHDIITVGAFTAHSQTGAKPGGLIRLLQQSKDLSSRQAEMTANSNRLDAEYERLRFMKNLQNILVTHMDTTLLLLHKGFIYDMRKSMIGIRTNLKLILDMWNIEATEEAMSKVGWNKKRIDCEEAEKRSADNLALQTRLQTASYRSACTDEAIKTVAALIAPSITNKRDTITTMEAVVNGTVDGTRTAAGVTRKVAATNSVNIPAQAVPKPADGEKAAAKKRTTAAEPAVMPDSVKIAIIPPETAKLEVTTTDASKSVPANSDGAVVYAAFSYLKKTPAPRRTRSKIDLRRIFELGYANKTLSAYRSLSESDLRSFSEHNYKNNQSTRGKNDNISQHGTEGIVANTSGVNAGTGEDSAPEEQAATTSGLCAATTSEDHGDVEAAGTTGNNDPEQTAGTSGFSAAATSEDNGDKQTAVTTGNNDAKQGAGTGGLSAAATSEDNGDKQTAVTTGNNDAKQGAGTGGLSAAATSQDNGDKQTAVTTGNNDAKQGAGTGGLSAAATSEDNGDKQTAVTTGNNDAKQGAGTGGLSAAATSQDNGDKQTAVTTGNNDAKQGAGTGGLSAAATSEDNGDKQTAVTTGNNDAKQGAGTGGLSAAATSQDNGNEQAAVTTGNNDPEQAAGTSGVSAAGSSGNNDPGQAAGTSGLNAADHSRISTKGQRASTNGAKKHDIGPSTSSHGATASSSGSTASVQNANRLNTSGKSNRGKPRGCKNNRPPKQTRQDRKEANKEALRLARGETSEAAQLQRTVKMHVEFRNATSLEQVTTDHPFFNKKGGANKGRRNRRNVIVLDQDPTLREYNMNFFITLYEAVHEMIKKLFTNLNTVVVKGFCTATDFEDTRIFMDLVVKLFDEIQRWNRMAHTAMRIDTESPTWAAENSILRTRRHICFSQAVTAAAAGVLSWVTTTPEDIVARIVQSGLGPLLEFEGLLSMYAEERTMWGDMVIAVEDLHTLTFKFVPITSSVPIIPQVTGTRSALIIEIPIMGPLYSRFQNMETPTFTVTAVFFNIGINDKASLAEALGDNRPQNQSNKDSYERMFKYYLKYCQVFPQDPYEQLRALSRSRPLEEVMENLHSAIIRRTSKNVEILHLAALATRHMHGVRFTSCKSAKDRTGMSVSLEQATVLSDEYHMTDHERKPALDIMRSEGCRRENTVKNIGQRKYAFTKQQVKALPEEYRPPHGTYGAGIHET